MDITAAREQWAAQQYKHAATWAYEWAVKLMDALEATQPEHPPADERRIWWPDINRFGQFIWPDGAMCFQTISSRYSDQWYASATGKRNYLPSREEAAKWLYDQCCGPYHQQPAPIVRHIEQDEVTE